MGNDYDIIIVIPVYDEDLQSLIQLFHSLSGQKADSYNFLVLILINHHVSDPAEIKERNYRLYDQLNGDCQYTDQFRYDCYLKEFMGKKGGVGRARKSLMDGAFNYFYKKNRDGLIVNLDADSYVESNYISAIANYFGSHSEMEAASIRIEHPVPAVHRDRFEEAAMLYELHLRYFINMQRLIGFPYAFQTIGSSMAVRAFAYAKEGGMVKKQAGEDFYFLHKFSRNYTLGEINTTRVIPSCRPSGRVPFGTGRAVRDIASRDDLYHKSYNPKSFSEVADWRDHVFKIYNEESEFNYPPGSALKPFLSSMDTLESLESIRVHTAGADAFRKRFYQWFDAFKLMKALHFLRDNIYPDRDVNECVIYLLDRLHLNDYQDAYSMLCILRDYDKSW